MALVTEICHLMYADDLVFVWRAGGNAVSLFFIAFLVK